LLEGFGRVADSRESASLSNVSRAILQVVDDLDLALHMADVADDITQTAFATKKFKTQFKDDGTPVTEVDVTVEESLVRVLNRHRPDDAVLSEELGAQGRSRRTWIIDGIDGTGAFVRGGSGWGTLIALRADDDVTVGAATSVRGHVKVLAGGQEKSSRW
jgi:histidinol-phosphatase